jgi:UDP-sugar transporter A1/2/3
MVLSTILLLIESGGESAAAQIKDSFFHDRLESCKLATPGLLYACHGFFTFFAMAHLNVAIYQILYQTRILTTGLLSLILLNKHLTKKQWTALAILMLGVSAAEYSHPKDECGFGVTQGNHTATAVTSAKTKSDHAKGLVAMVPAIFLSSFSTVLVEKILKKDSSRQVVVSIWLRNLQLAVATFCPLVVVSILVDGESMAQNGLFHGYTDLVSWSVPVSHAVGGLLVSCVIKYADSVIVAFLASAGILTGLMVDMFAFDVNFGLPFAVSAVLVGVAIVLYTKSKDGGKPRMNAVGSQSIAPENRLMK